MCIRDRNRAPLKRNIGSTMKLIMRLKPSILSVKVAIKRPTPANPTEIGIIRRNDAIKITGVICTPTTNDSNSKMTP